jgi:hypothetical protein
VIEFLLVGVAWVVIAVLVGLVAGKMMRPVYVIDPDEFCVEDECRLYATHERLDGATTDGIPIVDLVCHRHAGDGSPR